MFETWNKASEVFDKIYEVFNYSNSRKYLVTFIVKWISNFTDLTRISILLTSSVCLLKHTTSQLNRRFKLLLNEILMHISTADTHVITRNIFLCVLGPVFQWRPTRGFSSKAR